MHFYKNLHQTITFFTNVTFVQAGSPGVAGGKGKRNRKSTDNLHPNLLPEDYLDEVIGQYFNADSSGEDDTASAAAKKLPTAASSEASVSATVATEPEKKSVKQERNFYGYLNLWLICFNLFFIMR